MTWWLERQRENGRQTLRPKMAPSVDHVWRDKGKITEKLCLPQLYPWNKKLGHRSLQSSSGGRWESLALSGKLQPCGVSLLRFLSAAVVVRVHDISAAARCRSLPPVTHWTQPVSVLLFPSCWCFAGGEETVSASTGNGTPQARLALALC